MRIKNPRRHRGWNGIALGQYLSLRQFEGVSESAIARLTPAEQKLVDLCRQGRHQRHIAQALRTTRRIVRLRIRRIRKRLGLPSLTLSQGQPAREAGVGQTVGVTAYPGVPIRGGASEGTPTHATPLCAGM